MNVVPKSRVGDMSTALVDMPGTPRISFAADGKSMSYSDDMTETVQGWIDGSVENWGIETDSWNCLSTDYFGGSSDPKPKFRMRVGIMSAYALDPVVRPRLIIEYNDPNASEPVFQPVPTAGPKYTPVPGISTIPDGVTPEPSPSPTPTPNVTPTPTPTPTVTPDPITGLTPTPTPTPVPGPDPALNLVSELGGGELVKGNTYPVEWQTQNIPSNSYVWIRLFKGEPIARRFRAAQ